MKPDIGLVGGCAPRHEIVCPTCHVVGAANVTLVRDPCTRIDFARCLRCGYTGLQSAFLCDTRGLEDQDWARAGLS